ncbi:MAG: DUF938 domain-containing protein [Pseudomonadota bacterium]
MTQRSGTPPSEPTKPVALEARQSSADGRRFSPSIARNRDAVRSVFQAHMPGRGTVLEVASGTGEHGAHIVSSSPDLFWQYSDMDADSRASQSAWRAHSRCSAQLGMPVDLDVTSQDWPAAGVPDSIDAVFCANMVHISPIEAAVGLFAGAGRHLRPGGRLMLYGPFARQGEIAPSNAAFSADLKRRDPAWGVRDLDEDLGPLARAAGLVRLAVIDMPANNFSVIYRKDSPV